MPDVREPSLPLRSGHRIPLIGFGTYPMKGDECRRAVGMALEHGYRHVDTADIYGNQEAVGAAVRESGVPREELFLTSKVWRDSLRHDDVLRACDRCLAQLGVDRLDLFLIHWPNEEAPVAETLRAMARLLEDGRIRDAGVSNFTPRRLADALALEIAPISVNQVEYHPLLNQKELLRVCRERGVVLTAYSPLALGKVGEEPLLREIAARRGRTPEQVTLRWLLEKEIVAIPKASSAEHIASNLDLLGWVLEPEEFEAIDTLDRWVRLHDWDIGLFDQ